MRSCLFVAFPSLYASCSSSFSFEDCYCDFVRSPSVIVFSTHKMISKGLDALADAVADVLQGWRSKETEMESIDYFEYRRVGKQTQWNVDARLCHALLRSERSSV